MSSVGTTEALVREALNILPNSFASKILIDVVVDSMKNVTQTLTNKTITSPTVTTPTITGTGTISTTAIGTAYTHISTATAAAAWLMLLEAKATNTTGTVQALRAVASCSVDDTAGSLAAIGAECWVASNKKYVYGVSVYSGTIANKTITQINGVRVYMEDTGNAAGSVAALSLNRNNTNVGSVFDTFIEIRNHGAAACTSVMAITGLATHIFDFGSGGADLGVPLSEYSSGTTVSHRLSVLMPDSSVRYLHLFTS